MNALKLGRWLVIVGAILIVIGLVTGFAAMMLDGGLRKTLNLLGLVPFGILSAFSGTILVVLTEPRSHDTPVEPEPAALQLEPDPESKDPLESKPESELSKSK